MPQPAADRNLLFGILAMQMDFITREQLISAMQAWVFDKSKSLGEILQAQKVLAEDNRALLDALVRKHLAQHDNDPEKSLAALSSAADVRTDLEKISDPDVQASLIHVSAKKDVDPYATAMPSQRQQPTTGMRFRVVRPHAKGGLGEVFIARDEELNREVALKEIQDRQADNQDSRTRFMLEAEITGGLEHPGIVPVYGLGTYSDGRPYYAMRFIRGDSLKEAIDKFHRAAPGSLSEGERSLVLRGLLGRLIDVCNAMAYAHARGILHRDIKPGNIMLGKYGETLVVDWGLAKPLGEPMRGSVATEPGEGSLVPSSMGSASATMAGSAVGTPHYMSPEQAAGRLDQLGPASDVYSLGATLYCILTGKSPVSESDVGTVLRKVQQGDFPRPRTINGDVSPALEAVCLKALALKPSDRYASPRDLADDIEHWLADEPVTAWKEPWSIRTRRWIGRHATLVTSVGSAVVVALIGFVIATGLLTAANERERAAKDQERLAKEKAEQNYQLARQAVDRYHTDVSESILLNEPGMQPLRKDLLTAAQEFYEKFRKERDGDTAVQGEFAKATYRLALITADIDSRPKAIKLLQEAATRIEALPADKTGADYQADLAATYHHLGRLYRQTGDLKKAEESYGKAITLWEQSLKGNAKDARGQAGLARSQLGMGNVYQTNGMLDAADKVYQSALDTRQALVVAEPKVAEYQRDLAVSHNNRAVLYKRLGKNPLADHEAALKLQERLVEDYPHISQYQDDLARTHLVWGILHADTQPDRAALEFTEAARLWQALRDRHPAHTDYRKMLADTNAQQARADRKRAEQVVAEQRKLAAQHKDDASFQINLARGLRTLADTYRSNLASQPAEDAYREALAILEKLKAPTPSERSLRASLFNGLGLLYGQDNKTSKAIGSFNEAKGVWEQLVTQFPGEEEYAIGLSTTFCNLGNLSLMVNNPKDADGAFTKAQASLDSKKLKAPNSRGVSEALRDAHWGRAKALTALKRYSDAVPEWDHVIALAKAEERPFFQLPRALTMAQAGMHREATKEAATLLPHAKTGLSFFSFAKIYAVSLSAVVGDKQIAERERLETEYAGQSFRMLDAARQRGLFRSPEEQRWLDTDPDLAALRDRPEFKKLALEIKGSPSN